MPPISDEDRQQLQQATELLLRRMPDDEPLLRRAVNTAVFWHADQRRRSGELFVLHPLAVALILADQELSAQTVVAGVLHDVLEDTDCPPQEIAEQFGEEVLALVEGVTKIVRVAPRGTPRREKAATYRKLILAAAQDARVLVIKLADRLHNLRTIAAMTPNRQLAIATETMEIYAPLAHRLGMGLLREELEDRSLAIIDPRAYEEAQLLQQQRLDGVGPMLDELMVCAQQALTDAGLEAEVASRVKSKTSIARKVARSRARAEIFDVLGMRVIVETEDDCYRALGVLHRLWTPRFDRFKDYIAAPRSNLYQSLHTTVVVTNGQPLEIQIRTARQHQVAEHGIAAHWLYKETLSGGGPPATRRFLDRVAEGQSLDLDEAYAAIREEAFDEEIYVFTPQGDVHILPQNATAIDFAYAVHSELGDRCIGVRVNGELRSLARPLQADDVVEILTSPNAHPSRDWLEFVQTARARQRIQRFYQADLQRERSALGLRRLQRALRDAHLEPLTATPRLQETLSAIGMTYEQAIQEAARDESGARMVVRRIARHLAEPAQAPAPPKRNQPAPSPSEIIVEGLQGVQTRLAACCAPEPGDDIVGYVSLNRGVSVHRISCRQVMRLVQTQSPRLVAASWGSSAQESFPARVSLVTLDRSGLLSDLSALVADMGVELAAINLQTHGKIARGQITCTVHSARQADELRSRIGDLEGVLQAQRGGAS